MLAITAMEPPGHFYPESIRNEKAKGLQAAHIANELEPWKCCVRGQYSKGGNSHFGVRKKANRKRRLRKDVCMSKAMTKRNKIMI